MSEPNLNGFNYIFESSKKNKNRSGIEEYLKSKQMIIGVTFAVTCLLLSSFVGGVMIGETKNSNRHLIKLTTVVKRLTVTVEQNSERYRVQRAADLYLQKRQLNRLYKSDSIMMMMIRKK